jgi:N-carbamoylputrescine amidase
VKVTVCELPHEAGRIEPAWAALCAHTQSHHSDWVLLPEFAFVEPVWQRETFDAHWATLVTQSEARLRRLGELGCAVVVGARPILDGTRPYNDAFLWRASGSIMPLRRKAHLPDEPGGWGARWFHRGAAEFPVHREADVTFGVNICTEMWAMQTYAAYADQGVHAVLSPRATGAATTAKWLALGTTAAARSGTQRCVQPVIQPDPRRRLLRWRRVGDQPRRRIAGSHVPGATGPHSRPRRGCRSGGQGQLPALCVPRTSRSFGVG